MGSGHVMTSAAKAAPGMDVMVLACTHFPLLTEELSEAAPNVIQVDGAAGIARRIAFLTEGQEWPGEPSAGVAVFTAAPDPALIPALPRFGLERVETL